MLMVSIANGHNENQLLSAALDYARRGWSVLPLHTIINGKCSCDSPECGTPGKHPLTQHGVKDATTDEATIRRWWTEAPIANVGIATGPASGLFMLGPDGVAGINSLAELAAKHEGLPVTARVRSGGGGQHHYFAWPPEGGIKTGANYNGLPIDVRGSGGLVVAPPSLHKSGSTYGWEVHPDEVAVAPAPAWLLDWLRSGRGTNKPNAGGKGKVLFTVQAERSEDVQARAVAYLEKCAPAISGQRGHDQIFEVARAIVYGFNLGPEVGFDLLAKHYNPRCVPPWSEKELRHKCADADTKPFDKPRGHLLADTDGRDGVNSFLRSSSPAGQGAAGDDIEALPMPVPEPWPELAPEALHGLSGEIVRTLAPQTESDPVAILGQLLVAFGNAAGRGPHYRVEGDSHHANLFLCLVGKTSRARKGTSRGRVMQLMAYADETWCKQCVASGLSSGEGLIAAVRDPVEKREPIKDRGRISGYQMVVVDEGVADKRLLADESEFAQVLKVLQREGNSLSPVIRQSWDTGNLRTLTKNSPLRATGAHISIAAHITRPELIKHMKDTEALNGFANRFLWLCARRSKLLPDGGRSLDLSPLGTRLNFALASARNISAMRRDQKASGLWHEVYPALTADQPGVYGAVIARAEAQVLRLSIVYALLDASDTIKEQHLRAALALWTYAGASVRLIFGSEQEDPLIGLVLAKLETAGSSGMTRTDLHHAFSRNLPAAKLLEALAALQSRGDAYPKKAMTGKPGAPAERWYARRTHELNELTCPAEADQTARGISSLNSFVRRLPASGDADGEEVVTV
jgi:hypothetical protein